MKTETVLTAVFAVLLIIVFDAILWIVYGFSVTGASYLLGNMLGTAAFVLVVGLVVQRRRPRLITPTTLAILTLVLISLHWREFSDGLDVREAQQYLDGTKSVGQIKEAATTHPNNKLLSLFSAVYDLRTQNQIELNKLMLGIEPAGLKPLSIETATDATKLNAFVDDLRRADDNARYLVPRYQQMTTEGRLKLTDMTKGFASPDTGKQALIGYDKGAVVATRIAGRVSSDLVAVYQGMLAQALFLQQRIGTFSVKDGLLQFKDQATLDAFNGLHIQITTAGKRYADDLAAIDKYRQQQEAKVRGPF